MSVSLINRITHLHVDERSRDCDGPHEHGYVVTPNEGETGRELFTWYVNHHTPGTEYGGRSERYDDADGLPHFNMSEGTDEGYRSIAIEGCVEERCTSGTYHYRDVFAEAAGY